MKTEFFSQLITLIFKGVMLFFLSLATLQTAKADSIWNGGGTDDNWNDKSNWVGNTAPVSNANLKIQFEGSTRTTPNVENNYILKSLTFNDGAAAFTVGGPGGLTVQTSITNADNSLQTINNNITLGNANTWSTTSTGDLTMGGFIVNGGNLLTVTPTLSTSTITLSNVVSGTGGITMNGAGTLILSSANFYSGPTTISSGTVNIGSATALGTSAVTFSGNSILKTGSAFGSAIANNITINPGITATIDVNNVNNELSGVISGAGSLNVISSTAGQSDILTLSGTNTYTGGTVIGDGGLQTPLVVISKDSNLGGAAATTGTITFNNGALRATSDIITARRIILGAGGGNVLVDTGKTLTMSGVVSGNGVLAIGGTTTDGATTTIHDGTVVLGGTNTFTNDILIGYGTLQVSSDENLGNAANNIFLNLASAVGSNTSNTFKTTATLTTARAFNLGQNAGDTVIFDVATGTITTINGVISETAQSGLTKNGLGTLVLGAANTYTGPTTIDAGILQLSGAGTLNNNTAVTVASGATFITNNIDDTIGSLAGAGTVTLGAATLTTGVDDTSTTFSGVIDGAGALTKDGTGTMTLSGILDNTYTGITTIKAGGALNIQKAGALGDVAAGTIVDDGGSLQIQGNIQVGAEALTLNGTGVGGNGALRNISGNNRYSGAITVLTALGETRINSDAGTLTIDNANAITGADKDLTVGGAGNVTISGVIDTGTGTLTKDGAGTLTLSDVNEFTGDVTINNGTISINTIDIIGVHCALGKGAAVTLGSAGSEGTLEYTGAGDDTNRAFLVGGAGGGRIDNNGLGLLTLNGNIENGANTLSIGGSGNTTINGVIGTLAAGGGLTKDGIGTLILSAANTYTGATTINGGILQLSGAGTLGDNSAVTVASGATLDCNDINTAIGSLAGGGNVDLGTAILTMGGDDTSTTFSGRISGDGAVTKTGTGTQTLSGANTYTGVTTIETGGALNIQNASALGDVAAGTIVEDGGSLQIQGSITVATEALTLNGIGVGGNGALRNISGNNTFGGAITLALDTRINSDAGILTLSNNIGGAFNLTVGGTGNTTISGIIDTGAGTLTKDGTGTLTLSGANTFTGDITINNGTISITSIAALGAGATVTLGSAGTEGALAYSGAVNGSTNRTFLVGGAGGGRINTTGLGSLTVTSDIDNGGNPLSVGGSGNTILSGIISGAGALTKDGAGTATLGGVAHTYSGATTVTNGELALLALTTINASDVTVGANGTLSGSGSMQSLVNNGRVSPGTSTTVGTLTVATGNYSGAGTLNIKITGALTYDQLVVTAGTATFNGQTLAPTLTGGYIPAPGTVFANIITSGGGDVGTFASVTAPWFTLRATPTYNANSVDLTISRYLNNPALNLDSAQQGLATSLTVADNAGGSADLTTVLNAITALTSAEAVRNAYDQILPRKLDQVAISTMTGTKIQNGNLNARMNNLRYGISPRATGFVDNGKAEWNYDNILVAQNGDLFNVLRNVERLTPGKLAEENKWGIFANGSGLFASQDSGLNQTGYDFFAAGATLGVDYRFTEDFVLGLATGYNYTKTTIDNSGGKAKIDTVSVAPYASYKYESFYFDGTVGYAHNFYDTERRILFGGIDRTALGSPGGDQIFSYADAGYDYKIEQFITGPITTLQYTKLWIDQYTETGADALNLDITKQTADSLQSGIGWHWAYLWEVQDMTFIPNLTATYQHEFMNDSRSIEAKIAGGTSFQTPTANPQRDFADLSVGFVAQVTDSLVFSLNYSTQLGVSSYTENAVNGSVRFGF